MPRLLGTAAAPRHHWHRGLRTVDCLRSDANRSCGSLRHLGRRRWRVHGGARQRMVAARLRRQLPVAAGVVAASWFSVRVESDLCEALYCLKRRPSAADSTSAEVSLASGRSTEAPATTATAAMPGRPDTRCAARWSTPPQPPSTPATSSPWIDARTGRLGSPPPACGPGPTPQHPIPCDASASYPAATARAPPPGWRSSPRPAAAASNQPHPGRTAAGRYSEEFLFGLGFMSAR